MRGPRIPINLSHEPFARDRKVLIASAALAVLLFAVLVLQFSIVRGARRAARNDRVTLAKLEAQLRVMDAGYAGMVAELRRPASTSVIDRSAFLNLLLQRKGVSWTQLFSDLTTVMPGAVRLVAVRPYLTADNRVQLDMVVGSTAPEPMIELILRLENSPLFGSTALLSSQPPSQNEPLYRYRVSVSYAQKL